MSEQCHRCQKHYETVYRVPNEVWKLIYPGESLGDYPEYPMGGLLCVDCAWVLSKEAGVILYFDGNTDWPDNRPDPKAELVEAIISLNRRVTGSTDTVIFNDNQNAYVRLDQVLETIESIMGKQ